MSLIRSFASFFTTRFLIGLAFVFCLISFGVGVMPVRADNDINTQISYQGKLLDSFGQPVTDGTYQMAIGLYNVASGGVAIWTASGTTVSPTNIPVTVTNGLFTIMLGDTSAAGGWQNDFTGVNWNNTSLYLGVKVSPDSAEMTPRKRIGAVPQAFNAQRLQGMYASSTAADGSSLFVINQTAGGAASAARTALEIRSKGTSDVYDYLLRGVNNQGSDVLTVNRSGSVTSTAFNITRNGKLSAFVASSLINPTTSTFVGTFGGVNAFEVRGKYGYVLSNSRNFDVVDLSGLSGGGSIARIASPFAYKLSVVGNRAYLLGSQILYIVDISDPTHPSIVSSSNFSDGTTVMAVEAKGNNVYIAFDTQIKVIDVTNASSPRVVGTYSSVTKINGMAIQGAYAYIADRDANLVRILDIHNPAIITQVGSYSTSLPRLVTVEGALLAVSRDTGSNSDQFVFLDVSNPASPVLKGTYNLTGKVPFSKPIIRGRYLYIHDYYYAALRYEIEVLDIGNLSSVVSIQNYVPPTNGGAIAIGGNTLFVPSADSITFYPLTQVDTTGLRATVAEINNLSVRNNAVFEGEGSFMDGLSVTGGAMIDRLGVSASGTRSVITAINTASSTISTGWGGYINTLLVGNNISATGTADYQMVLDYNGSIGRGICIDNTATAATCPSGTGSSIIAEGAITGLAYDLAEHYQATGEVGPGDLVTVDTSTSSHVIRSSTPYDNQLLGIVSTQPGFVLGQGGVAVALVGRVPTHVSTINGPIAIGDALTSSIYPGVAMKATQPGRIIGYALEAAEASSTIEVFVHAGYDASTLVTNAGTQAALQNNLLVSARTPVNETVRTADSWGLTFRGSAWDGSQAVNADYALSANVYSATSSEWSVRSGSSTLFALDQNGNARILGDLFLGGKLFPSTRSGVQNSKYIFLDDRDASSTYMATNADGWQTNDSYDFAERYYSPDALTPGDVVVVSQQGRFHVQRSMNTTLIPMGIVSTRPGFVTGMATTSTYPIALAGRVPTKVSTINGSIQIGDLLAPSSIPGVAMKATSAGPVVGQALENFSETTIGSIEVFVHTGWWGGAQKTEEVAKSNTPSSTEEEPVTTPKVYQGLAKVTTKGQKVHIQFPSVGSYPLVQVTPYGEVEGSWWTEHYTHDGFDIVLKKPQEHELSFAWRVEGMTPEESKVPLSDGTVGDLDLVTGNLIPRDPVETTSPVEVSPTTTTDETDPTPTIIPASTDVTPSVSTDDVVPVTPVVTESTASTTEEGSSSTVTPLGENEGTSTTSSP